MYKVIPEELREDRDEIFPILEESLAEKHKQLSQDRATWMNLFNCQQKYWNNRACEFSYQGLKLQYRIEEKGKECSDLEIEIRRIERAIKEYFTEEIPTRGKMDELKVEEARQIPCEEIIQQFGVQLKKAGRQLSGCCPLHNENTPSFFVDPVKNVWYCQGCHKGGDVIKFIEHIKQLNFVEAVKYLTN